MLQLMGRSIIHVLIYFSALTDKVKAKLNAKMRIRRKRVNGMSPGQRVLGSAIARSCQPRHVDE